MRAISSTALGFAAVTNFCNPRRRSECPACPRRSDGQKPVFCRKKLFEVMLHSPFFNPNHLMSYQVKRSVSLIQHIETAKLFSMMIKSHFSAVKYCSAALSMRARARFIGQGRPAR